MLTVYITVKSLGKKRNHLDRLAWELPEAPPTLRALIESIVATNVRLFNDRKTEVPLVPFLTQEDIELQGMNGKVGFGTIYNEQKADEGEAVAAALLAFEDGLFRVFHNDDEAESLDAPLALVTGDEIAFIRFTMLAGRLW